MAGSSRRTENLGMAYGASQLLPGRRPKWLHVTTGVGLITVAVALTVGWQILGNSEAWATREASGLRWFVYFLGTLLFSLLIGGLVLIVVLLLREVRLNERQSNFISAVTHELKTPVASLKLYLDTLQMRELPPARRDEFYRTMQQDLERLHSTINNILQAAIYADRPVVDPKPLDFARLVHRSVELTRTRHQLPAEAFTFEGPPHMTLTGDTEALETAVLNLLDNAVKYSRDPVRVDVELATDGDGQAQLRVRDQGIGMSRAHLRFVFNRFYRIGAEVRRSHRGTGLGLYIVKSVVNSHRGTVSAESGGPDRGSTFTITLPGVLDERSEQAIAAAAAEQA
jgi:signal transduction histidine kinase